MVCVHLLDCSSRAAHYQGRNRSAFYLAWSSEKPIHLSHCSPGSEAHQPRSVGCGAPNCSLHYKSGKFQAGYSLPRAIVPNSPCCWINFATRPVQPV